MVICLTGARFNMKADVVRQTTQNNTVTPENPDGDWIISHDPDSNEIIRKWVPAGDDPSTPVVEDTKLETFSCIARGIIDGGIRVAGTTERFGDLYENIDYIFMTVGPKTKLSKRDRITNIRSGKGVVLWKNEEEPGAPPTVFSVLGVTPVPDPWGNLVEQRVLLERAERQ